MNTKFNFKPTSWTSKHGEYGTYCISLLDEDNTWEICWWGDWELEKKITDLDPDLLLIKSHLPSRKDCLAECRKHYKEITQAIEYIKKEAR